MMYMCSSEQSITWRVSWLKLVLPCMTQADIDLLLLASIHAKEGIGHSSRTCNPAVTM